MGNWRTVGNPFLAELKVKPPRRDLMIGSPRAGGSVLWFGRERGYFRARGWRKTSELEEEVTFRRKFQRASTAMRVVEKWLEASHGR